MVVVVVVGVAGDTEVADKVAVGVGSIAVEVDTVGAVAGACIEAWELVVLEVQVSGLHHFQVLLLSWLLISILWKRLLGSIRCQVPI